jgi:hypothetical protein
MCLDLIAREFQKEREREAKEARLYHQAASARARHPVTIRHLLARLGSYLVRLDPQDDYCVPISVQPVQPDRLA